MEINLIKIDEVVVSATVFESKLDQVVVPLDSESCTILYNTKGDTATVTYNGTDYELPFRHAIIFNQGIVMLVNLFSVILLILLVLFSFIFWYVDT